MRVALISEHANPLAALGTSEAGGQNVHVGALGVALAEAGHQVEIFVRRDCPDQPETVPVAPGVEVVHVPAGKASPVPRDHLLPLMPQFGAWLRRRWSTGTPPDVVHAHHWMSGVAAGPVCRRLGVPFVQTFHVLGSVKRRHLGDGDPSPPVRQELERRLACVADAVIATSTDEVDELELLGAAQTAVNSFKNSSGNGTGNGTGVGLVRVVPCGVDLSAFSPKGLSWPLRAGDRYRVICLGRLVERKGIDTMVAAMSRIEGVELLIAGGSPADRLRADTDARRLQACAVAWGVADRVHLLGRIDRVDVPGLLRSADLLVSVPVYEPFGIVPLEAMACGVPVVASAVGGMLDTIVDGVTGLHVRPGDVDGLSRTVARLLADPTRRRALGEAAVLAARRYSWKRVATETVEVYASVRRPRPFVPRLLVGSDAAGGSGDGGPPRPDPVRRSWR